MTQKFNYQGYTICVTFRSDNALSMTASFNLTGEHFINDMIELTKIKKDTVLATLAKKSPKNLSCKFQFLDANPRKLIISFVVNFDYLPEFSQDIVLQEMQIKGEVLNKISSVEIQSDVNQIQKILNAIQQNGPIHIQQKNTSLVGKKTPVSQFDINQGSYLLQISGMLNNPTTVHDSIEFYIKLDHSQEQITLKQKSYNQHSYAYPYFFSLKIESKGGKVQILAKNYHNASASITNQIITLIPILGKV